MPEPVEKAVLEPAEERDPYGGVALGVECAWPMSIPVVDATPAEVSP
jgi:hypothetical protein